MTRYRHLITDDNRKWWTLGAMCFALFMIMLDNTVVNVALPSIQKDLGASISGLEWTINGYTLSFAVLLATGGRLGDIFGRRRMFLAGVVIFAASSATAGLAPDETSLVVSRIVQGVGAALMMPGTLSIITDAFPAHERGKAMGTWAGVSARSSLAASMSDRLIARNGSSPLLANTPAKIFSRCRWVAGESARHAPLSLYRSISHLSEADLAGGMVTGFGFPSIAA